MSNLVKIIVFALSALLVIASLAVGIILLIPEKTPGGNDTSSVGAYVPEENITDNESKEVINNDKESEKFGEGEFIDKTKDEQKQTSSGELGGSNTLDVIRPDDSNSNSSGDTSSVQWLDGIW